MAAGMSIFTLFGSILVDSDEANKSISKTEKNAESLSSKLGKGIATAGKVGVALGGMAVAGGAALLGVANNAAQTTDRIDKLSQKIGMGRESFQEWDYVLGQNGINIDVLQGGMKTLVNKFDDLKGGSKSATESFDRLNLSVEDLEGMSQDEIFNKVIEGLQGVEDSSERAAIANDLLGRSGSELAPLLNAGAEATEELKNKAHELGLVMSDEAVDAGVLFSDTLDDVKKSFGAMITKIGVEVMPIIQKLLEWITTNMPTIQSVFSVVFGVIKEVVDVAVDVFKTYMLPILTTFFDWIKDNFPTIKETFKTVFETAKTVISEVWKFINENLLPIFAAIFETVQDKFPQIKEIIVTAFDAVKNTVSILWEIFKGLWEFIEPTFPLIGTVIETALDVVIGIVKTTVGIFEGLSGAIKTAIEWITGFNNKKIEDKNFSYGSTFGNVSNSLSQYNLNGSHANGLEYVPFDGYVAELHKGERVLTAEENQSYSNTVNHVFSGVVRVEGIDKQGQFQEVYEYVVDTIRKESRT